MLARDIFKVINESYKNTFYNDTQFERYQRE